MTGSGLVARIVRAVAATDGVAVEAVPPLYEAIDPEILHRLDDGEPGSDCRVVFGFAGHQVTVTQDSRVRIDDTAHPPVDTTA